jgi:hypothetical protein
MVYVVSGQLKELTINGLVSVSLVSLSNVHIASVADGNGTKTDKNGITE